MAGAEDSENVNDKMELDNFDYLEKLAINVEAFPVLYDKAHRDFHRLDIKVNAWAEIGKEMEASGEEMEKEWKSLRARYGRVKRELQSKTRLGKGAKAIKKAKQSLRDLDFLSWLDEFMKPRKARGNFSNSFEKDDVALAELSSCEGDLSERPTMVLESSSTTVLHPPTTSNKRGSFSKEQEKSETAILEMNTVAEKQSSDESGLRDEHDVFGELIAKKLRRLADTLEAEDLDEVQLEILRVLSKARKGKNSRPSTSGLVTPGY